MMTVMWCSYDDAIMGLFGRVDSVQSTLSWEEADHAPCSSTSALALVTLGGGIHRQSHTLVMVTSRAQVIVIMVTSWSCIVIIYSSFWHGIIVVQVLLCIAVLLLLYYRSTTVVLY